MTYVEKPVEKLILCLQKTKLYTIVFNKLFITVYKSNLLLQK